MGTLVQEILKGLFAGIALVCFTVIPTANAQSEFEFPASTAVDVDDTGNGTLLWTHNSNALWAGVQLGTTDVGYFDTSWNLAVETTVTGPGLGSVYDLSNLTITIALTGLTDETYTIAAVATDDYEGQFLNLGDIVLTGANVAADYGSNNVYGFLSVGDGTSTSAFTGTIEGSNVEVTGTGEIIGVYFKGDFIAGSGKQDIGAGAKISFGDICVETTTAAATPYLAGAAGFAAGSVHQAAEIALGNIEAYASNADWATGVEFDGDVDGTLTITSITAEAQNGAAGLLIYGNTGGDITIGETGTITAISANGIEARGMEITGNMTGTIDVAGDIETTGFYAAGIQISGNATGTINVDGNIDAVGAGLAMGILVGTAADTILSNHSLGNVTVTGDITAQSVGGDAFGIGVSGQVKGNVEVGGKITASGGGNAAGFASLFGGLDAGKTVSLQDIEVTAVDNGTGVRFTGDVFGALTTGDIYVETTGAGAGAAIGIHVVGSLDHAENEFGAITVVSANTLNAGPTAAGIWTKGNSTFTLNDDITVDNAGGTTAFGILVEGGFDAEITLGGNVTISVAGASINQGIGLHDGNMILNLDGYTLTVADVNVTKGAAGTGKLTVTGGGTLNTSHIVADEITLESGTHIASTGNIVFNTNTINIEVGSSAPVISADGDIDLDNAVLNIDVSTSSSSPLTIIDAGGNIDNFNPSSAAVTIAGLTAVDFLSVSAYLDGNAIKVTTQLSWNLNNPDTHGTFTLGNGAVFTVDSVLADQNPNPVLSWDGKTLTKKGAGTLILNGINTYTGLTTVEAGTLGGNGTISGGLLVKTGATLSPGNSIGTFTVIGDVTFESGATYLCEVNGINADQLIVHNGIVTILTGAELQVVGTPTDGHLYKVIDLQDSATFDDLTEFNTVSTWGGYFTHNVIQGDGYYLTWKATPTDFANTIRPFGSPNAINAAAGMDRIVLNGQTANVITLYNSLSALPSGDPQGLANAFAQLHGEVFATSKEAAVQMQRRFQSLLPNGRDFYNVSALPKEWNLWGTFTGDYNNRKKLDKYSGYEAASAGFAFGVDKTISTVGLCGVAFGYDYVDQDFRQIRSSAEIEAFRAMLYGSWFNGEYYCDAYAGYTKNRFRTKRSINIGTFSDATKSSYDDDMGSLGVEIGRAWSLGWCMLTPSVGLHYNFISSPTIIEEGGEASLRVASSDYHSVRLPIGVKLSKMFPWDHGSVFMPEIRAFYIRELANDTVKVRTAFVGARDVDFEATSGVRGQDNIRLGLGVGMLVANRVNFRLDYDCDIYNNTTADTFSITLGVSW